MPYLRGLRADELRAGASCVLVDGALVQLGQAPHGDRLGHELELLQGLVDLAGGGAQEELLLLRPQLLRNLYWFNELQARGVVCAVASSSN